MLNWFRLIYLQVAVYKFGSGIHFYFTYFITNHYSFIIINDRIFKSGIYLVNLSSLQIIHCILLSVILNWCTQYQHFCIINVQVINRFNSRIPKWKLNSTPTLFFYLICHPIWWRKRFGYWRCMNNEMLEGWTKLFYKLLALFFLTKSQSQES